MNDPVRKPKQASCIDKCKVLAGGAGPSSGERARSAHEKGQGSEAGMAAYTKLESQSFGPIGDGAKPVATVSRLSGRMDSPACSRGARCKWLPLIADPS